jgi:hypothetical protein
MRAVVRADSVPHKRVVWSFACYRVMYTVTCNAVEPTPVGNRLNPKFWCRAQLCSVLTTMSTSGLKAIAPVPTAADFLDIVLSKTQRKTPTVRLLSGRLCLDIN